MGIAKRWMEEVQSRGYDSIPCKHVCPDCVNEDAIKKFVDSNRVANTCSYCGKKRAYPIAASVEDVVNLIIESICSEWLMPEDSGTPYESREGGWLVEPSTTEEVLEEEGFDSDEPIYSDVTGAITGEYWLKEFSNPMPEVEILYDWESFCSEVKHKSRYVFFRMPHRDPYGMLASEETTSCGILDVVANYCAELDLVKTVPKSEKLYRARVDDLKRYSTVNELGPPPVAPYANRMSPSGVVMFYGAGDAQTAIIEAASGNKDRTRGVASIGEFKAVKDLKILDFSESLSVPSIFDSAARKNRVASMFMRGFLDDFQKGIEKDRLEHIEYVPTQVVTEYFRYLFKHDEGRIVGIKYKSAQNESGFSYVIFAEQKNCVEGRPSDPDATVNALLSLDASNVKIAHIHRNDENELVIGALGYWAKPNE